jgi:hypothetical protein
MREQLETTSGSLRVTSAGVKVKGNLIKTKFVIQFGETASALCWRTNHSTLFYILRHRHNEVQEGLERIIGAEHPHRFFWDERGEQSSVRARAFDSFTQRDLVITVDKEEKDERHTRLSMPMLFEQRPVALHPSSDLSVRGA